MLTPKPRPHISPKPLPRRLPERKRMTIALGILAPDGVVIAADTQETYGLGWSKYEANKIVSLRKRDGVGAMAASGGGDAGYLDALHQDYLDEYQTGPHDDALQERLQNRLTTFYEHHV